MSKTLPLSLDEISAHLGGSLGSINEGAPLLLAVSGGADSIAMMGCFHLLTQQLLGEPQKLPPIHVASVDHGLREAAKQEAIDVGVLAQSFGFTHHILKWEGEKPTARLQERARDARYGLLHGLCKELGAKQLFLAHTLDDQAETVLMRLSRGSGVAGLAAMSPSTAYEDIFLIRPFLHIEKQRLIATNEAHGWPFIYDPSNENDDYTRVRWRKLMPLLAEEGLDAHCLYRFAERMTSVEVALDDAALSAWKASKLVIDHHYQLQAFLDAPTEIMRRMFDFSYASLLPAAQLPRLAQREEFVLALRHAETQGQYFKRSLGGVVVEAKKRMVIFTIAPPRGKPMRVVEEAAEVA